MNVRAGTLTATHWPAGSLHVESFAAPSLPPVSAGDDTEFEVEIAATGEVIPVRAHQTILDVLRARGYERESFYEAGTCGACRRRLLKGEADHQDFVLADDECRDWMMVCVSRAKSRRLKLEISEPGAAPRFSHLMEIFDGSPTEKTVQSSAPELRLSMQTAGRMDPAEVGSSPRSKKGVYRSRSGDEAAPRQGRSLNRLRGSHDVTSSPIAPAGHALQVHAWVAWYQFSTLLL